MTLTITKKALIWWDKQLYITKCELIVKYKENIAGYPSMKPNELTSDEIKFIFDKENNN